MEFANQLYGCVLALDKLSTTATLPSLVAFLGKKLAYENSECPVQFKNFSFYDLCYLVVTIIPGNSFKCRKFMPIGSSFNILNKQIMFIFDNKLVNCYSNCTSL